MSELPEGCDESDIARFSWKPPNKDGVQIMKVSYRGVRMTLSWHEGERGHQDVLRFFGALPKLYAAACNEIAIDGSMRGLDNELDELLGGDGE